MSSISSNGASSPLVYYGHGAITTLRRHERVVLKPGHYAAADLATLGRHGTTALAYLSLSEDPGPSAPWHRPERNAIWGGHYVQVAHPAWQDLTLQRAEAAFAAGFAGLFLDTLELPADFGDDRGSLVALTKRLRTLAGARYLLANRGFDLYQELAPLVDGFLFEAFSTTWEDGYRALSQWDLLRNVDLLNRLRGTGRDLYALDYAVTYDLAAFARARAATHRLPCQVSNRELTRLTCTPAMKRRPTPAGRPRR